MSAFVEKLRDAMEKTDLYLYRRGQLLESGDLTAADERALARAKEARNQAFDALEMHYAALRKDYTEIARLLGYVYAADGLNYEPGPSTLVIGEIERLLEIAGQWGAMREPALLKFWDEGDGVVLWWRFPVTEPPYVGTPLDDDFPDYVTHWTLCPVPVMPVVEPDEYGRYHDSATPTSGRLLRATPVVDVKRAARAIADLRSASRLEAEHPRSEDAKLKVALSADTLLAMMRACQDALTERKSPAPPDCPDG